MATEFITQLQFVSSTPGLLQANGLQPTTLIFNSTTSNVVVAVTTYAADPLCLLTGTSWLRIDDINPNVSIPALGAVVSENTAPVITATVEQPGALLAQ
jgi:hypothetical protein